MNSPKTTDQFQDTAIIDEPQRDFKSTLALVDPVPSPALKDTGEPPKPPETPLVNQGPTR